MRKFERDHDNKYKAKRKADEHAKLRKELDARCKDIAKNMEYSPMVGCNARAGNMEGEKDKPGMKICRHKLYGCIGGENARTAHKSEASKFCTFVGKSKDEIREIKDKYFLEHPEAKAEYEKLYGKEVRTECTGNVKKMGGEKDKTGQKSCRHKLYGCIGAVNARTAHKSEVSRFCTFVGKSKDEIREIKDKYFLEHPEAKAEYERLYGKEVEAVKKKAARGKN